MTKLLTFALSLLRPLGLMASAGMTSLGIAGALLVLPGLNGGEPRLLWSLAAIGATLCWGGLILQKEMAGGPWPGPTLFAIGLTVGLQLVNALVLILYQGLVLLMLLITVLAGTLGLFDIPILLVSNIVLLLVIAGTTALVLHL